MSLRIGAKFTWFCLQWIFSTMIISILMLVTLAIGLIVFFVSLGKWRDWSAFQEIYTDVHGLDMLKGKRMRMNLSRNRPSCDPLISFRDTLEGCVNSAL